MRINIDLETFSPVPLEKTGVYPYAQHKETEVVCACWSIDGGEVQTWKRGMPPPSFPEGAEIFAFNCAFDSTLWYEVLHKRHGWPWPGWQAFKCSMAMAAYGNLPGSLGSVAKALGAELKDADGKALMLKLCKPAKPTTKDDDPKRLHTAEAISELVAYCQQDVRSEASLHKYLPELPANEEKIRLLDAEINRRGWAVDRQRVKDLILLARVVQNDLRDEMAQVTKGKVSKETQWIGGMEWLNSQGLAIEAGKGAFDKKAVAEMLARTDLSPDVRRFLQLKQALAKSSLAKLERLLSATCADGRVRGLFQYYGAHQTGRWAGRIVQPQNLPKGIVSDYDEALALMASCYKHNDFSAFDTIYGSADKPDRTLDVISSLIRTCFVAPQGSKLVVCDYSAIEARVLAWLANETWRLEVFKGDGKIYECSSERMFNLPAGSVSKANDHINGTRYRDKGKVAELALGFAGGVGALEKMGGADMGLSVPEMQEIVDRWREASPNIVRYWRQLEDAAKAAIHAPGTVFQAPHVRFMHNGSHLWMKLPSGRCLWYRDARITQKPAPWDASRMLDCIVFMGEATGGMWMQQDTFSGRLCENAVQSIARDILANGLLNANAAGLPIVAHVHDEIICEVAEGDTNALQRLTDAMLDLPPWAKGLPMQAAGWEGAYYKKDA